jgi:hypothetical protein
MDLGSQDRGWFQTKGFSMSSQPADFPLCTGNGVNVGTVMLSNLRKDNYPASDGGIGWPRLEKPETPSTSWLLSQCAAVLGPALSQCNAWTLKLSERWQNFEESPGSFYNENLFTFQMFANVVQSLQKAAFVPALGGKVEMKTGILYWPLVPLGTSQRKVQAQFRCRDSGAVFKGEFTFVQDVQEDPGTEIKSSWGILVNYSVAIWGPLEEQALAMQLSSSSSSYYSTRSST